MQPKVRLTIAGTGSYLPETVLSNADLERMVETSDEWITTRTGIKERRRVSDEQASSDLALEASRRALEMAGLEATDLDAIIFPTITPDHFFPATACLLQEKLGCRNDIMSVDMAAACSGFLYGLNNATGLIGSGLAETVLVRAQMEAVRAGDAEEEARCLLHLSSVARALGDPTRALETALDALERFVALAQPAGMADSLVEAGSARVELGRLADAAKDLRGALDRFEEIGNQYGIARCHNALGDVLRDQGDLRRAQREYQLAQEILERVGSPQRIVPLLNHGLLWLKRGHLEEARAVFEVGLQIVERLQRRHLECYVQAGLLACLAGGDEWDAWDRKLEHTAALLGETGAVASDLAWPLEQAGDRARRAGERARAVRVYRLALDQWRSLGQEGEAERVERQLAACEDVD